MIKGWRNNPNWISLYESRAFNKSLERQMTATRKLQEQQGEVQRAEIARQEEHRRECHAQHEEAGTLTSQRGKTVN